MSIVSEDVGAEIRREVADLADELGRAELEPGMAGYAVARKKLKERAQQAPRGTYRRGKVIVVVQGGGVLIHHPYEEIRFVDLGEHGT